MIQATQFSTMGGSGGRPMNLGPIHSTDNDYQILLYK